MTYETGNYESEMLYNSTLYEVTKGLPDRAFGNVKGQFDRQINKFALLDYK